MAKKTYYWVDPSSVFGGGDSAIKYGDKMPDVVSDESERATLAKSGKRSISPDQEKAFLASGQISTVKTAGEAELSELENLKSEKKSLKGEVSEQKKIIADSGGSKAEFDAIKGDLATVTEERDKLIKDNATLTKELEAATNPDKK